MRLLLKTMAFIVIATHILSPLTLGDKGKSGGDDDNISKGPGGGSRRGGMTNLTGIDDSDNSGDTDKEDIKLGDKAMGKGFDFGDKKHGNNKTDKVRAAFQNDGTFMLFSSSNYFIRFRFLNVIENGTSRKANLRGKDWEDPVPNTAFQNMSCTMFALHTVLDISGTSNQTVAANITAYLCNANYMLRVGNQSFPQYGQSIKFTLDMGSWPFLGEGPLLINSEFKSSGRGSLDNTTNIKLGDGVISMPLVATMDGVEKPIRIDYNTHDFGKSGRAKMNAQFQFPKYNSTLSYDPTTQFADAADTTMDDSANDAARSGSRVAAVTIAASAVFLYLMNA